jgi:hypothetical protein
LRLLETEIEINAGPERVWAILTDFDKYPEWNPFIKKAKGTIRVDEKLEICLSPPNSKETIFNPTVKKVVENSEISWLGHLLFPGIFDGEHIFTITKSKHGCMLVQKEKFRGLLVPLLWRRLNSDIRAAFELMNNALKERAEHHNT